MALSQIVPSANQAYNEASDDLSKPMEFQMIIREPKIGPLTEREITEALSKELVDLLIETLEEGDAIDVKGSVLNKYTGLPVPADLEGDFHPNRRADIDIFAKSTEIYTALLQATETMHINSATTTTYSGNRKLRLNNGLAVDLNDGVKTAESLQSALEQFIETLAALEEHVIPPTERDYVISRLNQTLSEITVQPFDPRYALHSSGFLPLESLVLTVTKKNGTLQADLKDPFQIVERADIAKQTEIHSARSNLVGVLFDERLLEYSPYYWALYAEAAKFGGNHVLFENSDFIYSVYANLLKLARIQVESNITVAPGQEQIERLLKGKRHPFESILDPHSPIAFAAISVGTEDLAIRPSNEDEYRFLLASLRGRAQLEFARAAASDTRQAIMSFFVEFPYGGLIYEQFKDRHYLLSNEANLGGDGPKGENTANFFNRLSKIYKNYYPVEPIQAVTTINPDITQPLGMEREMSAGNMSEVIGIVLAADGYTTENCQELVAELVAQWQPNKTIRDAWFYGNAEEFDATLDESEIINYIKRFQNLLDLNEAPTQDAHPELA